MKDVREMFNISYFDSKELSLKEHCDIYSNIKKELISILNKYDIKYVLAETEVIKDLSKENQSLKKQLEENKDKINWYENFEINKTIDKLRIKHNNQQKEFIEYLEDKKDRLASECSNIYEDSLGKTRLVNEDIFNEVNDISQKYKSITGDDK